jgi:hypothetical protein
MTGMVLLLGYAVGESMNAKGRYMTQKYDPER